MRRIVTDEVLLALLVGALVLISVLLTRRMEVQP